MNNQEKNILLYSLQRRKKKNKKTYDSRINWKDLISWEVFLQNPQLYPDRPLQYYVLIKIKRLWSGYFFLNEIYEILSSLDSVFNKRFYNVVHIEENNIVIKVADGYGTYRRK
jgi:hypothetical protein